MRTKIYLILSIIIQIILAVYSIITADSIVQSQITELQEISNMLPEMKQELMLFGMTQKEVIIVCVINIVLNIIAGIIVLKNNTVKRKGSLISIYVVCLLTTPNAIASWIAVISIILLSCVKREKQRFNMKEAEASLRVQQDRTPRKQIVLIIIFVTVYLLQLVPDSVLPDSKWFLIAFVGAIYLALLVLATIVFEKEIKHGFKAIRNNFKIYAKYTLRVLAIMFVIYFIVNIITVFTTNRAISSNQETLEMLPIIIVAPLAIVWAPIVEEALYRGVVRKVIKNDTLYIIISSIVFGLMHVIGETSIEIAIVTTIPYAVVGGTFAYIYSRTNNLMCNMIAHSIYNTLGVLLMILK